MSGEVTSDLGVRLIALVFSLFLFLNERSREGAPAVEG
jgi:hypothetical protein